MDWAITKNNVIELFPRGWNSKIFIKKLNDFGLNTSLSSVEPSKPLIFGDIKILPVTYSTPELNDNEILDEIIYKINELSIVGTYSKREKTDDEINNDPEKQILKRKQLENKYLETTKNLIVLAGDEVPDGTWPKLEDVDFEVKAAIAMENNMAIASLLLSTLNYTFFQLKLIGWKWEDIEYRIDI